MQTPIDLSKMLGRNSVVQTETGPVTGTILAAGVNGVSLSVDRKVVSFTPGQVLSIKAS